jgi:hypothetical protein
MKKVFSAVLILFVSASLCSAKNKMPADLKMVTDKMSKITADYFKAINKVKNAKELAAAINKYAGEIEKLAPQIKAMEAKYGNNSIDENSDDDDPADTDDYDFKKDSDGQMSDEDSGENFMKIQQYYSDPAVIKAVERLNKAMLNTGLSDEENKQEDTEDNKEEE